MGALAQKDQQQKRIKQRRETKRSRFQKEKHPENKKLSAKYKYCKKKDWKLDTSKKNHSKSERNCKIKSKRKPETRRS